MQCSPLSFQTLERLFNESLSINLSSKTAAPFELKWHVSTKLPKPSLKLTAQRKGKPKQPLPPPSQELLVPSSGTMWHSIQLVKGVSSSFCSYKSGHNSNPNRFANVEEGKFHQFSPLNKEIQVTNEWLDTSYHIHRHIHIHYGYQ